MTEKTLYDLLKTLQYPVAYDHFDKDTTPPFILFRNTDSTSVFADNKTIKVFNNYIVDMVTVKHDTTVETSLENLFNSNNIPFTKTTDFIDSERIYQTRYFIN